MTRKKILFIHETLDGGGAEKVFVDLINRFDRDRYAITVLLIYGGGTHEKSLHADIELITLFDRRTLLHKVRNHFITTRNIMLRRALSKDFKNRHFDTTISFLEGPAIKVHSFILDKADKNVSWVHANLQLNHWSSYMFRNDMEEQSLYRKMDTIVFVSEGIRKIFMQKFDVSVPTCVIHNVIDRNNIIEQAARIQPVKQKFTIINVGRLSAEKRHDRLLEAAALLCKKGLDFELWLLGTGALEQELKKMATELGLHDRVQFLGFQSNPYPYLKCSDLFLLTSDSEGLPTVICEALCLGLPVVSTRITGAEELLDNGVGILTEMTPQNIADKVYEIATNPAQLQILAVNSQTRGETFNPDDVLRKVYDII